MENSKRDIKIISESERVVPRKKIAIISSHPIQYNAPMFRLLTERGVVQLKVFYTWGQTESGIVYDPDFKRAFKWDIPLLDGYDKEFIENVSSKPGAGNFNGIKNRNLVQRILEFKPDVVLVFGWGFHSHLQLMRKLSGKIKIVFRGDSTLLDEPTYFSLKKLVRRFFLTWVYTHVDVALYTGEANREYYLKHGLKPKQLIHASHAVENNRFYESEDWFVEQAEKKRKQIGIPTDALVFLFAGKLEPKKAPETLINAFRELTYPFARLLIVGNGRLEKKLKELAKDDHRILFLDFQNQQQMPIIYRLGDVFVLPSLGPGETWGLSVNEAMACRRAVVVSNKCGCAKDLVRDNGFIFEAGDINDLKQRLMYFADRRESAIQMGQKGFELIQQFSFDSIASVIEGEI